jgi:predicted O-linked N-acetylglucosamine transferase (SPINDLY family)
LPGAIALTADALNPRRSLLSALVYADGITGKEITEAARDCSARIARVTPLTFSNSAEPDRELTVGLLSGLLKTHPVGWLTIAGLEALDPAAFSIVALAHNTWSDMIARRFHAIASDWQDISTLDDTGLARKTRELGIDVLIELGGYGEGSRITACAQRLAPVQIKWVGMQSCTTGMPEIDWMLSDRWETPPEQAQLYTERLLTPFSHSM